jgi:serine/threonine protein kinase
MENCTPEVEDLFRKMFEVDPIKRITFSEIRQHPVFAKHFPVLKEVSVKLYNRHNKLFKKRPTA